VAKTGIARVSRSSKGIAFNVELNPGVVLGQQVSEGIDIIRAYMPLIWAWMYGDAACALGNGLTGSIDHAGLATVS
jgi:hypothetical protein